MRTRSHNTVTINDKDQMLPIRKFKYLNGQNQLLEKLSFQTKIIILEHTMVM